MKEKLTCGKHIKRASRQISPERKEKGKVKGWSGYAERTRHLPDQDEQKFPGGQPLSQGHSEEREEQDPHDRPTYRQP